MAVLGHSFEGAILGYFVARAMDTDAKRRLRIVIFGFTVVTSLHFLYDFVVFAVDAIPEESVLEDLPVLSETGVLGLLLAHY